MEKEPTNRKKIVMGASLNDVGFRVILIPFLGIVIPLISGMLDGYQLTLWQLKMNFLYGIGISLVIWEGNRYLLFTLRAYFNWFNKPVRKLIALVLAVSAFTIPACMLMMTGWYHLFANGVVNWPQVFTTTVVVMVTVLFIVHIYETVFLVKESASEMLRNEQLERARTQAELEALKNQIDPHFIFNSLNTLSHLIEETPSKARRFNDSLAEVYRYILQSKKRDLVLLREETDFLESYFSLLKIRFENAVHLRLSFDKAARDRFLIPPISLQVLVENAIKHNRFSDAEPLFINIRLEEDALIVQNRIRKRVLRKASSGIGLYNLAERYKLTTQKAVTVQEAENDFIVHLPVLRIA